MVFYDVLGDVVCGGFAMPMRSGYADRVFILTSGENMALHAAANIAMAVEQFRGRGYATLGGLILNCRQVPRELEKVQSWPRISVRTSRASCLGARPCRTPRRWGRPFWRPSRIARWRHATAA